MIEILYFARLREQLGRDREQLPGAHFPDLQSIVSELQQRGGEWQVVFGGDQPLLMALNQEMSGPSAVVADGDEVAFFPPVTGG